MKIKSLFRRSVITLSYIMVFLSSIYFMHAQCPTVNNPNPIICDASGFTFNDLNAFVTDNGDGILWYSAATGGSAFTSTQLVQEGTYYAESNSGSCAPRPSILVDFVVNPSGQVFDGFYCSNENPTIQTFINNDIQPFIPGSLSVAIFYDPDLTILANATDALSSAPTNYYIVLVDGGGCESQVEVGFAVVFNSPTDPTPVTPQEFCSDTNPTVADLDTGTTNNFNWFASVDGLGNPIPPALNPSIALSDGENYFIRAYEGTCTSNTIEVTVNLFDPVNAGTPGTIDYCDDNIPTADFDLFPSLVGMPNATGTWTGPSPISANPQGTTNISGFGAGIYVYTYTVPANGACPEDSSTVTITISETFTSGIPSTLNPATFCEAALPAAFDLSTLLDNEDPNGQWTQGTTSTDPVVTSPIDLSGFTPATYNFTYTQNVSPNLCPEVSTTVQVVVLQDPNAGLAVNAVFCENELTTNSPYDLFNALDGSQDNNSGTWTDISSNTVASPIDITAYTVAGSPYLYTYTIDNGTCSDSEQITITIEPAPESGTINGTIEFCEGTAPVTFNLFDLLDNEDQTGTWYIGTDNTGTAIANPVDLSGYTAATFDFTFDVDAIGICDDELVTVQVTINPLPNTGIPNNPAPFCENDPALNNTAFDLFTLLGPPADAGGTWTDDDATGELSGNILDLSQLVIGAFNFTYGITDANGCSNSTTVTIVIDDAPESGTVNGTTEFCEGTAPVTFNLFDLLDNEDQTGTWYIGTDNTGTAIANPIDLSGYTAATYDFTFDVDAIGICDDELVTVQVTINPLPNTGIPNNPAPFCENDPALNTTAFDLFTLLGPPVDAGGTWTDDDVTGELSGNILDLSQLVIGTFNFTYGITDANGCSNSTTVTIVIDDAPESGTVNGTIEFCEGTAPVTFNLFDLLDNEDQTGTWYVGTDNTGTAIANPVDLSGYTAATYDFTFDVDAIGICDDELVTVQVTINPLPNTGTATPRVFCENDLAANSPFDLFGQLAGNDAGGTWTDDDATGALTGNSVDLTLLTIGSYNFTYSITDANMCSNSSTVVLTVEDAPSGGTVNASPEFCLSEITTGQTINLFDFLDNEDQPGIWNDDTASGQLAGSVVTLDGLAAGTYSFTYDVDAIGTCDDPNTPTVTVIINDTPAPAGAAAQAFCDAATIADLSATGTAIQWYDEAIGGTALLATTALGDGETYYATQTDATTGCESATRLEVTVSINQSPNAGAPATTTITGCNNTTVNLNTGLDGSQDTTGTWMDDDGTGAVTGNAFDTNGIAPGTYNFTYLVIAVAPCLDDSTTITVTVEAPLSAGTANGDLTFCSTDATYNLFDNITGADIGGTWSFNSNTVSNSFDPSSENVSGTYTYVIANVCGNDSVSFDVNVSQAADAGTDGTFIICIVDIDASNSVLNVLSVLNGTPNTSGTFTNDDAAVGFSGTTLDLTQVTAGTYNFTYTVTAVAPCTMDATAVATVTVNDSASATVNNATPQFCASENPTVADLEASVSGTAILWYAEPTTTTSLDTTEALINGEDYYATQTDTATGCESSLRVLVTVTVGNAPTPTLIEADQELCINDAPTIAALTDNISEYNATTSNVLWYDAVTNGSIIGSSTELTLDATYYAVLIDPVTGCESSIRLEVNPDVTSCGILVVPDGFSPNGDGVNDTFYVDNLEILYPKFEMEIYNRYGNIVYKGNASTPAFDGKSNQSRSIGSGDLPVGVYYYIFNFNDGVNKPEQGRLYLNR